MKTTETDVKFAELYEQDISSDSLNIAAYRTINNFSVTTKNKNISKYQQFSAATVQYR